MTKTIAILANSQSETLIAAGEVVELRFREGSKSLSLRSAKLFHLLVNHAGARACDDIEHSIRIAELNFSRIEIGLLIECVRDLVGTQVELTIQKNGKPVTLVDPLLYGVQRDHDLVEGTLVYRLSPTLRFILEHSNHWAALSRGAVLAFESRYALRLYELISLRHNLKHKSQETFDLSDLRRRLGVPENKMRLWADFRRFALEMAIAEVNQLSGYQVSYTTEKRGRRIDRVSLSWFQNDVVDNAKPDQDSPTKPQYNISFPPHGGLKFGQNIAHWRDLAETHVKRLQGGHLPDLSELANQFRAWCASKNLPLDASGIEKAFIGFCQKYRPPNAAA